MVLQNAVPSKHVRPQSSTVDIAPELDVASRYCFLTVKAAGQAKDSCKTVVRHSSGSAYSGQNPKLAVDLIVAAEDRSPCASSRLNEQPTV